MKNIYSFIIFAGETRQRDPLLPFAGRQRPGNHYETERDPYLLKFTVEQYRERYGLNGLYYISNL